MKPLKIKNYGSIPHLPQSRMGPSDKHCEPGQARIATEKPRDKNDEVIVQEKLDGSNVGIARHEGKIIALTRAGYLASTSPFEQHLMFDEWVQKNKERFKNLLQEGERLVGEWLAQAHGTRYELIHEPFVAFDLMKKHERTSIDKFLERISKVDLIAPKILHRGESISVEKAMEILGEFGFHGAVDPVEGCMWRVERDKPTGVKGQKKRIVDFLVKFVRPDKEDGIFLPELSEKEAVWNWHPHKL